MKKFLSIKRRVAQKGFTLIETLVAIAVIMISIAGPMTIAHRGLAGATYAKDQITAYYLAQDALEFIRQIRDNNLLNNQVNGNQWISWSSLGTACNGTNGCIMNTTSIGPAYYTGGANFNTVVSACSGTCPPIEYQATADGTSGGTPTGLYSYYTLAQGIQSSWVPTPYTRTVRVENMPGGNYEVKLTITVTWQTGVMQNSVVLRENLFNQS